MKFRLLIILFISVSAIASAQENIYDPGSVPKQLMPYASAVVRNSQEAVEIKDLDNTIYYVKKTITVFNKNGDKAANVVLEYDKLTSIKYAKGVVYNSSGAQLFKFSEKDFKDEYNDDGFSLYQDARVKYYIPPVTEYPYTIEYEYEIRLKQTLALPDWKPNPSAGIAVENSKYSISCKPDFAIRYKEINMPATVNITTGKDGIKTYEWQINSLKAIREEAYEPVPLNYLSEIKVAPVKFEYDGVTGSFTNWNELGKFVYDKLLVNRQIVSPETAERIKELTSGITDSKLKAKKIYEYMQERTRYVSIQVGIGGFQPFSALDVDNLKYGDCKALVNYTQALLKVAGIDSYYCIVNGDHSQKISPVSNFASMNQFNHIILCLPFKNDTTWCDCTSQEIPFGYLGDFTDDRLALACTPDGGKIMHTTIYPTDDNIISHTADMVINADGSLTGNINTTFKGTEYDDRDRIISESQTERLKDIQRYYPINNMHIEALSYEQDKSLKPVTTEHMSIKAPEYASITDDKLYFLPTATARVMRVPPQAHSRATDTYINDGYIEDDEISFTLPPGYHMDSEPLNVDIKKPFGAYKETSELKDGKLIYHRVFKLIGGTYSKDAYQDLVGFFSDVYDYDGQNLTFVKK
jgi:transglutaminase-like putative cysteine protease